MTKYMIAGWGELLKNPIVFFRESLKTNADGIGRLAPQAWNVREFAELSKTFLKVGNELRMLNENILNNIVQWHICMVDIMSSASAIKEFDTIRANAMTRLVQKQADLINHGMENGASHLEILKRARGSSDVVATQMDFLY